MILLLLLSVCTETAYRDRLLTIYLWFLGFDEDLIILLKEMYSETLNNLKMYICFSRLFQTYKGIRQGIKHLRFSFNLAIHWLMSSDLDGANLSVGLDDLHVADMDFADEKCLLFDNKNDAQALPVKVT